MPVDDLLVGQHGLVLRTPVDRGALAFSQARLKQLHEDPLRPAIISGIGGLHLVGPVEAVADAHQLLFAEASHVLCGQRLRVQPTLDGEILAVDAESIKAHRLEHVEAVHRLPAAMDVRSDVGVHIADVQPFRRGIGKHHQVVVGALRAAQVGPVEATGLPTLAPLSLELREIVARRLYAPRLMRLLWLFHAIRARLRFRAT